MPVVAVTQIGAATGSRAAAAALACAASEPDRPAVLVDVGGPRPRPSLVATVSAQALEARIAAHVPLAAVAARGQACRVALPATSSGVDQVWPALAVGVDSIGVVHAAPSQLESLLNESGRFTGALLRANPARDRALVALAARGLMDAGLRVAVLKAPLGWVAGRCALAGLPLLSPAYGLPPRICGRLLDEASVRAVAGDRVDL